MREPLQRIVVCALALFVVIPTRADDHLPAPICSSASACGSQLPALPAPSRRLSSWREALSRARTRAPELLRAQIDVTRAGARVRTALSKLMPTLAAQGALQHQFITSELFVGDSSTRYPFQDLWTAAALLEWNALDLGAIRALGYSQRTQRAAELELKDKHRAVTRALVIAMLATSAAERVSELNRASLALAHERLQLTEERTKNGHGTTLDVERTRQDVYAAAATVVDGDAALAQTYEALGLELGSEVSLAAPSDLRLRDFEDAVITVCTAHATIEQRADVEAARVRAETAEQEVEDFWLSYVPTGALQSQLLWSSEVLYGQTTNWSLTVVLRAPIWDGGLRSARLRDTRAAAAQARRSHRQLRAQALVELARASRTVTSATATLDLNSQQRDSATRIDALTRLAYQNGAATSLDLITSAAALRQAEINLVLSEFRASRARIDEVLAHANCAY